MKLDIQWFFADGRKANTWEGFEVISIEEWVDLIWESYVEFGNYVYFRVKDDD